MIVIEKPSRMIGGSTPCHCNGDCPYGGTNCPASTASGWIGIEYIDPPSAVKERMIAMRDLTFLRVSRPLRPEDV